MNFKHVCALILLAIPLSAVANDDPVYESFSGLAIGRVFFGPADRERLDANRRKVPQQAVSTPIPANAKPLRKTQASAGYIIGRSGQARVWYNGDFVASSVSTADTTTFPGDVAITRHPAPGGATGKSSVRKPEAYAPTADQADSPRDQSKVKTDAD